MVADAVAIGRPCAGTGKLIIARRRIAGSSEVHPKGKTRELPYQGGFPVLNLTRVQGGHCVPYE